MEEKIHDQVFHCNQRNAMIVKPSECGTIQHEVQFLGHTVGGGHCQYQDDNIERIQQAPNPTTMTR